jgi:glycosyltransferase involved in cell wall biosynthesis
MKLLIIIPAYNEEKTIGFVLDRIPKTFKGISKRDILVIDDGSKDRTSLIAKDKGAKVISHIKNKGVGAAFKTGVEYAIDHEYDIMVNMDGDGQFNPEDISKLIKPIIDKKAAFVTATRFSHGRRHRSRLRNMGNKFFTKLICSLIGEKFTDTQCGFRAYKREALLKLNVMGDFTYTQEVFIDLAHKNIKMMEVPVKVYPRKAGRSRVAKNVISYGVRALKIIIRSYRDYKPFTFFGLPGIILGSIGLVIYFICFIYYLIFTRTTPIKTLFSVGTVSLFIGLILVIIALLADMLDRQRKMQEEILYRLRKK